jgi:hypothetical protein
MTQGAEARPLPELENVFITARRLPGQLRPDARKNHQIHDTPMDSAKPPDSRLLKEDHLDTFKNLLCDVLHVDEYVHDIILFSGIQQSVHVHPAPGEHMSLDAVTKAAKQLSQP